MFKFFKKSKYQEINLYNKILLLSRDKLFFINFNLADTFQNRVNLIFLHTSFIFIKFKKMKKNHDYSVFTQKLFNCIFKEIETNLRENGYGDATVNKNMKFLVKIFYNILLECETYKKDTLNSKKNKLLHHLTLNDIKTPISIELVDYFEKYESFCFDLSADSILKGELNFIYK